MLTARGDDGDRVAGLELGADDYVPKPFNPRASCSPACAPVLRRAAPRASAARPTGSRSGISSSTRPAIARAQLAGAQARAHVLRASRPRRPRASRRRHGHAGRARGGPSCRRAPGTTPASIGPSTFTCPTCATSSERAGAKRIRTVRGVGYVLVRPTGRSEGALAPDGPRVSLRKRGRAPGRLGRGRLYACAGDVPLRSRLFSWFLGAILLAMATGGRARRGDDAARSRHRRSRAVALATWRTRLADSWKDDPEATRAFVAEIRDVSAATDVRVVRDLLKSVPRAVSPGRRAGVASSCPRGPSLLRPGDAGAEPPRRARGRSRRPPARWRGAWWRSSRSASRWSLARALGDGRGHVANQQAPLPLERLAESADRFGGGDLAFRADIARGALRWTVREVRDVAAVSFNRMADRVEAIVRGQRELLGAISHAGSARLGRARVALEIARDRPPPDPSSARRRAPSTTSTSSLVPSTPSSATSSR